MAMGFVKTVIMGTALLGAYQCGRIRNTPSVEECLRVAADYAGKAHGYVSGYVSATQQHGTALSTPPSTVEQQTQQQPKAGTIDDLTHGQQPQLYAPTTPMAPVPQVYAPATPAPAPQSPPSAVPAPGSLPSNSSSTSPGTNYEGVVSRPLERALGQPQDVKSLIK